MNETKFSKSTGMTPRRLESLADGIFAFAMTLLVLAINLPLVGSGVSVGHYLATQYENFFNFTLSFVLLAVFWLNHSEQFHHIKKTDAVSLWLNIFILMFAVLIPFSASLMNDYTDDMIAEVFFNSNMFALSSMLAFNWWYSRRKDYLEEEEDQAHLSRFSRKSLIFPAMAALAILISFIFPGWSSLAYLLIPVIAFTLNKIKS